MNKRGILHKLMLLIILVLGFGLALALPAFKRHQDIKHAHHALAVVQQIAAAEKAFYSKNGFYTADFSSLVQSKHCASAVKDGNNVLACSGYDIGLEDANTLRATSTKYAQWFAVNLENGTPVCEYEEGALVGEHLCRAVNL